MGDAGPVPADLTSISGLATSRRSDGTVWAVEDSFEPAQLVALDTGGRELGRVNVRNGALANLDWEAVSSSVTADGAAQIVIGDIGDNLAVRRTVRFYLFDEPAPGDGSVTPRVIEARYQDLTGTAVRPNAEAMVVQGDTVWVMDKQPDGPATLYRLETTDADPDRGVLVAESTVDLGDEQATAMDLSPDGTVLALRTDSSVRLYPVPDGADPAEALTGDWCSAPPPPEAQGESVAILPGTQGLLTVSEDERGGAVQLHRISGG